MAEEKQAVVAREYPLSLGCLMKTIFTLGLYLLWWATKKLVVTDKAVKLRSGLIGGEERAIPINRVTDVSVSRGVFGRILGYGKIRIESAGGPGTEIEFSNIQHPDKIRDAIISQSG